MSDLERELRDVASRYHRVRNEADEVILQALNYAYKKVTGVDLGTKLSEAIFEALQSHQP